MPGTVNYSDVIKLRSRLNLMRTLGRRRMDDWLHNVVGPDLKKEMQERAPVDTGNLRAHIVQINSPGQVSVGVQGVSYLVYVVEGTKPHEIRPKNASVLAFKVGGVQVFAKVVHHPGTKPNQFMKDVAREVIRRNLPRLAILTGEVKKSG